MYPFPWEEMKEATLYLDLCSSQRKEQVIRHADLDPFPEQKSGQNYLVGMEHNLK